MRVLLVGGAGYVGSHTAVALAQSGHQTLIVDDFSNAHPSATARISSIVGHAVPTLVADIRDEDRVSDFITAEGPVDVVIHLAGLKSVSESIIDPLRYYDVNISSSISLLRIMNRHGIRELVFSSSATVYGTNDSVPHVEEAETGRGISNPYGKTKHMIEEILRDVCASDPSFRCTALRYFNPVGAHPSGIIGEDPLGAPTNLMPVVAKVASGRLDHVTVYGADYETPDGTGLRDYIHIQDLARGHVRAAEIGGTGFEAINLGTGAPASVLEVINAFSSEAGIDIPVRIAERRAGDVSVSYAAVEKAALLLGWRAALTLSDACRDSWRWQQSERIRSCEARS